jgi:hypothetical protein
MRSNITTTALKGKKDNNNNKFFILALFVSIPFIVAIKVVIAEKHLIMYAITYLKIFDIAYISK